MVGYSGLKLNVKGGYQADACKGAGGIPGYQIIPVQRAYDFPRNSSLTSGTGLNSGVAVSQQRTLLSQFNIASEAPIDTSTLEQLRPLVFARCDEVGPPNRTRNP
jgi:hypothetical protein